MIWRPEEDAILRQYYVSETRAQIAARLGRTEGSIRSRCWTLGLNEKHPGHWTAEDEEFLRAYYVSRRGRPVDLEYLAAKFQRSKTNICRKAGAMGLTDKDRPVVEVRKKRRKYDTPEDRNRAIGAATKARCAIEGHPRGRLGKSHSEESRLKIAAASRQAANGKTQDERSRIALKSVETKLARYGSAGPRLRGEEVYSRCRGGRRTDLENRYFRSAWEANYARYLNLLLLRGQVRSWEYEVRTFQFETESRGARSYTPDFFVVEADGGEAFHEVKGWMDGPSKTRLARMAKHYPEVRIVLIDAPVYGELVRKVAPFIKGWEYS